MRITTYYPLAIPDHQNLGLRKPTTIRRFARRNNTTGKTADSAGNPIRVWCPTLQPGIEKSWSNENPGEGGTCLIQPGWLFNFEGMALAPATLNLGGRGCRLVPVEGGWRSIPYDDQLNRRSMRLVRDTPHGVVSV